MQFLKLLILLLFWSVYCTDALASQSVKSSITLDGIAEIRQPLMVDRPAENRMTVKFGVCNTSAPLLITRVELLFSPQSRLNGLSKLSVSYSKVINTNDSAGIFGASASVNEAMSVSGKQELVDGTHCLNFTFGLKDNPDLTTGFHVDEVRLHFKNHQPVSFKNQGNYMFRPALVLRAAAQDGVDTYRIPGVVTTEDGTLIAVYDVRYHNSKDLQEDIDIGMSRSTDGGQSWEPMKIIMDRGEWGGRPQNLNGIGDPCVLYDMRHQTIWVAGLWMSGLAPDKALWWASQPGLSPDTTGQFLLVKSTDNGLHWSPIINITSQIKNPRWQLLLQGPGRGITMGDGTLVFPAQFKEDTGTKAIDGGKYTCHSTIVYSIDGGNNWQIGTGAKPNTTESQVVQLSNGLLMLNMRDDRNRSDKGITNGRAVCTTADMGKTWMTHPSSNAALPEPNCQASIISASVKLKGVTRKVLFFSNPNDKTDRTHLTIKASLDEGQTWPENLQTELNAAGGFGYSCLTMVDDQTLGIVYEGQKDLLFQKIAIKDLIGK